MKLTYYSCRLLSDHAINPDWEGARAAAAGLLIYDCKQDATLAPIQRG